ncbi:MAG: DUF3656 domain-containing protein [Eubacteriales bacterium]|nr:DUF3656 domain-containing protein [Eubacteriales bacterium]
MKKRAELLAPAGSMESLKAAVHAGADAVYMGGQRFGARAYADNPDQDHLKEAIDYCHLHGRSLYLTVNTLLKEYEMRELYDYLAPLYEHGLDAAIVQDMGVLSFIRKQFPDLPVHASTQMTVTGAEGAEFLKELGVTRVVTARELSLKEIREIYEKTGMEIESFVHGALCYCYSGQCLFSSLIGGRSGNRGRCAQPCRLPYELYQKEQAVKAEGMYLLSPKDMCALELLPEILKSGVYSLKIEGRMKKPEYTAGVVRIYRKYLDLCLQKEKDGHFYVSEEDKKELMDLYNRGGFNEGYYKTQNGKAMMALKRPNHNGIEAAQITALKKDGAELQALEDLSRGDILEAFSAADPKKTEITLGQERKKTQYFTIKVPASVKLKKGWKFYRTRNQKLLDELSETYLCGNYQEKINGRLKILKNQPVILELSMGKWKTSVKGEPPSQAQKQPLTEEKVRKQMQKTGNTSFSFENLRIDLEEDTFLPVYALNELRREGMEQLRQTILSTYRREKRERIEQQPYLQEKNKKPSLFIELGNLKAFPDLLKKKEISGFYIDAAAWNQFADEEEFQHVIEQCHKTGKSCFYAMPRIFRLDTKNKYEEAWKEKRFSQFDGMLIRSLEEYQFLEDKKYKGKIIADHNLYTYNSNAREFWKRCKVERDTVPFELNKKEIIQRGCAGSEMILYGRIPTMISAQCLKKNAIGCNKKKEWLLLKDRKKKRFPVETVCRFCYNVIYNEVPLSLLEEWEEIKRMSPEAVRLCFTTENVSETEAVTQLFIDHIFNGETFGKKNQEFTRGHFKRGVE